MELNPKHKNLRLLHDSWHVIAAILIQKLGQNPVVITVADIAQIDGNSITVQETDEGVALRLVTDAEAQRLVAEEDAKVEEQQRRLQSELPRHPDDRGGQHLTTDPNDPELKVVRQDGQQAKYLVLSEEERAKGFKRPVRCSYFHLPCGTTTTMGRALAETWARDPAFYGATFCVRCGDHYPVKEFVWEGTQQQLGT